MGADVLHVLGVLAAVGVRVWVDGGSGRGRAVRYLNKSR
jgi:hypothetical protein